MAAKKNTKKSSARPKAAAKAPAKRSAKKPARVKAAPKGALTLSSIAPSLTVNDAAASLAWYCDVLGFTLTQRWERDGVLQGGEVSAGAMKVYIGQDDWQKGRDRVKGEGFRLYLETTQDIDRLAASIKARGGTLASEPKDEYGTRSFGIHDPTGYKITIASAR